jgi:WD40 repeat protein
LLNKYQGTDFKDLRTFEWDFLKQQTSPQDFLSVTNNTSLPLNVQFSPNGKWILESDIFRRVIHLRKADDLSVQQVFDQSSAAAFGPSENELCVAGTSGWKLFDFTQNKVSPINLPPCESIAFSPDNRFCIGVGATNIMVVESRSWNVIASRVRPRTSYRSIRWLPDQTLLVPDFGGAIYLWKFASNSFERFGPFNEIISACNASPDGRTFATFTFSGELSVWSLMEKKLLWKTQGHLGSALGLTFSPDSRSLFTSGSDQLIKVWDAKAGKVVRTLKGHRNDITSIAVAPDGILASGSRDKTLRLWKISPAEIETGVPLSFLPVRFTTDSKSLFGIGKSGKLSFQPLDSLGTLEELKFRPPFDSGQFYVFRVVQLLNQAAVSPDCTLLALAIPNALQVWDLRKEALLRSIPLDPGLTSRVLISGDNRTAAVEGSGRTILADLQSGTIVGALKSTGPFTFSPDQRFFASASSNSISIRKLPFTGKSEVLKLSGHESAVHAVAFTPDGKHLISVGSDSSIQFWNLSTGQREKTLMAHKDPIFALGITPDGRTLASGGLDDEIIFWDLASGQQTMSHSEGLGDVIALSFAPDGRSLFAVFNSNFISKSRVWTLPPR